MTVISLALADQLLTAVQKPKLAAGDVESVILHVDFSSEWDGLLARSASFYTDKDSTIYEQLLTGNECIIPHEVLANEDVLSIGIIGRVADGTAPKKTSSILKYKIVEGAKSGQTTLEPSPDMYQQYLSALDDKLSPTIDAVNSNLAAHTEEVNGLLDAQNTAVDTKLDRQYTDLVGLIDANYEETNARLDALEENGGGGSVSGGMGAEIIVNTYGGEVVCVSPNGEEVTGTQTGFLWKFTVYDYGVYSFVNTIDDMSSTVSVEVDAAKQYVITIQPLYANFADNSWESIITACQSGTVPDSWEIGDYKAADFGDNSVVYVSIIGKNHDTYSDTGETAPITFLAEGLQSGIKMNTTGTNVGGWESSYMRGTTLPDFLSNLPAAIQTGIRAVNKSTSAGNKSTTIKVTSDKLFLFSEVEHLGANVYAIPGEGKQYEYFKNGNELEDIDACWTRSPCYMNNVAFACRDELEDGTTPPYAECATANTTKTQNNQTLLAIAPCFCF